MEPSYEKRIQTDACEIWLDDEGFVRCEISKDLTLKDMKDAYAAFSALGFGPGRKKGLEILTSTKPYSLSKEARDYAGKHGRDFFKAAALVTNSALLKFLVNMFNLLQNKNQEVPFKSFSKIEEAIEWLKKTDLGG